MVHRRVQGLQESVRVLFLLKLEVSREVGDVDYLALVILEDIVHPLHDECHLGWFVVWILI